MIPVLKKRELLRAFPLLPILVGFVSVMLGALLAWLDPFGVRDAARAVKTEAPDWTPFEQRIREDLPEAGEMMDYSRALCECERLTCVEDLATEHNRIAVEVSTHVVKGEDLHGWSPEDMVALRATLTWYLQHGERCRRAR